jgi:hypothetical protein
MKHRVKITRVLRVVEVASAFVEDKAADIDTDSLDWRRIESEVENIEFDSDYAEVTS